MLVALAVAFGAQQTQAHGVQVVSDPEPDAQLQDVPEKITVTFNEPIEPAVSTIQLWDQNALLVELGELEFFEDPQVMAVKMPEELPPGFYTVIWRNLSTVDGHIWSGSFSMTMLGPGGALPTGEVSSAISDLAQAPSDTPSTLESSARWIVLLGSAIMLGGAAYMLFVVMPAASVLTPDASKVIRGLSRTVLLVTGAIGAFLVLEGSLLQLVVQSDRLGGLGAVDELLKDTRFGRYLIARQALLAVAFLALAFVWRAGEGRAQRTALGLLLLTAVGVIVTQSLVSHAAASDGSFWTTTIDLLHLGAAALWIGGLIHVGLAMPRWLDELQGGARTLFAAESFRRFSLVALVSVVALLASGVLSAFVQFTSWDELWSTSYGWSLIGKMAVMLPLLVVGGLNAFILQPRVVEAAREVNGASDDEIPPAIGKLQRLLSRTVRAEAVLGIVVLMAVAVLIQLQTPRSAAEATEQAEAFARPAPVLLEQRPFQDDVETDGVIMLLRIDPAVVGDNSFELGLGSEFGPVGEVLESGVELRFDHESQDVGSSVLTLPLFGSARYQADSGDLSLPGEWTVTVTVQRRAADDLEATFNVSVGDSSGPAGEGGEEPGVLAKAETSSIWEWPFTGAKSVGAIVVLAVVAVGAVGWQGLRFARRE